MLTKRERVLRTAHFQETDRVPVYDILQNEALIQHYAGEAITPLNGYRVKGVAIGQTLDEAFHWSSTLEESCQIELATRIINEPFIEYRGMSGSYSKF